MKRIFGLIGFPLGHSFSKAYFTEKFSKENISDASYENFELPEISGFPSLITNHKSLAGLNVTIPHKEKIMDYLDVLDPSARRVGAVNVIRIDPEQKLTGFNTDYYGFRKSLETWLEGEMVGIKAIVLGTGGSSRAVCSVLEDCNIRYLKISRRENQGNATYNDLRESFSLFNEYRLIINTTPLGMYPRINEMPNLPYQKLGPDHYLYDLIYNPEKTLFLSTGERYSARIKNGREMLVLQAEKSWEIWNEIK